MALFTGFPKLQVYLRVVTLVLLASSCALAQSVALSVSSGSGSSGGSVNLSISLNATGTAPVAVEWTLGWSTADISSALVTIGPAGTSAGKQVSCSSASGMSTCILWGINSNTISNGVIATVAFTISGSTVNTSSAIQLSSGAAAASTGASLSTSTTGSTVTIQQAAATFSISGTISPGGSGTMVMLTGTASSSTTANGSGNYTFAGLANGSYTVTPSNSGYTFTPSSRVVNVSGANVGAINFSGTANAQPDFSIGMSPGSAIVAAGGSTAYTITVSALSGFSGTVVFGLSGLPSGATGILNPPSLAGSGSTTLTVNTTSGTPAGTFTVIVTGTSGSLNHAASASLGVTSNSPPPVGAGLEFVPVTPCRIADTRNPAGPFGGPALGAVETRVFGITASACGIPSNAQAFALNLTVVPLGPLGFVSVWPDGQSQPVVSTLNSSDGRIKANAAIVPAGNNGAIDVFASNPTNVIVDINGYFITPGAQTLAFYPLPPCRIADTRQSAGTLGGPTLTAGVARSFPVLSSSCDIPASAQAYSLNVTAVPSGPLGFLTAWAAGVPQPGVSTLNAPTGTIVANAAIVPAGTGGAISVIATDPTDVIVDVNGYFAPAGGSGALQFRALTPCRILDTRGPAGPFGAPELSAAVTRSFPVLSSSCQVPDAAQVYSLNVTVVPPAPLGFVILWGNAPMPAVSTLNDSDGTIVDNAALVSAASDGSVNAFASNITNLILDINGYFAP